MGRLLCLFSIVFTMLISINSLADEYDSSSTKNSIKDIVVKDSDGNDVVLSSYKGNVLLIVNVASKCGHTPQYAELEKLNEIYNSRGLEILAFPCNDFGEQEPGSIEQIKEFCTINYGITFKLFDKIKVLGKEKSPLYSRLTNNSITGNGDVKWNFEKFIISKDGKIIARFPSKVKPMDKEIIAVLDSELAK